ncbi:MAG TPA: hypothetical protein PKD79_01515 [Candidatus Doudnabacteria bacterium]|nr:hypothetical protein [Candidatus Doudnabacteria bacterium]
MRRRSARTPKQRAKQLRLNRVHGAFAKHVGGQAERKFLAAWQNHKSYCQVIKKVEQASLHDDRCLKTDAMVYTSIPSHPLIRIQVKSSLLRAQKFVRGGHAIPVVWVASWDTPKSIRRNTIDAIVRMFPFLRDEFRSRGCEPPTILFNPYQVRKSQLA